MHRARQAAAVRAGSGQRSAGLRGARRRDGRAPRSPANFSEGAGGIALGCGCAASVFEGGAYR